MKSLECDDFDALDDYWAEEYEEDYVSNHTRELTIKNFISICIIMMLVFFGMVGIANANIHKGIYGNFMLILDPDGSIENNKTIDALEDINATAYTYYIGNSESDYNNFLSFLDATDNLGIKVTVSLRSSKAYPYETDWIAWAEYLANLSLEHPQLVAYVIDDFSIGMKTISPWSKDYFTPENTSEFYHAGKAINPNLKFLPCVYPGDVKAFVDDWDYGIYTDQQQTKGWYMGIATNISIPSSVNNSTISFEIKDNKNILAGEQGRFLKQVLVDGGVVWSQDVFADDNQTKFKTINITSYLQGKDSSNIVLRLYMPQDTGYICIHMLLNNIKISINSNDIDTEWQAHNHPDAIAVDIWRSNLGSYKPYCDGIRMWYYNWYSVEPLKGFIDNAKMLMDPKPIYTGMYTNNFDDHNNPVNPPFPEYVKDGLEIALQNSNGAMAWEVPLFIHAGYDWGPYLQVENDKPEYEWKLRFPYEIPHAVGFYQGITTTISLPAEISNASINFTYEGNRKDIPSGSRAKQLLVDDETVWEADIAGEEGDFNVSENITAYLVGKDEANITIRLYNKKYPEWFTSNLYITTPIIRINGTSIPSNWSFTSANALDAEYRAIYNAVKEAYSIGYPSTGTLHGTVSSEENPVPNATVSADEYETTTNEYGYYLMELPLGTYTVTATAEGYEPASENVTIASGNKTLNFSLSRSSAPTSIFGNIRYGCNETGIAGVSVNRTQNGTLINSTVTDSAGNYTFTDVSPGDYNLTASKIRFWSNSTSVTVNAGASTIANLMLWLKGDLNNDGTSAGIEDVAMMDSAWKDEITKDFRYDLNNDGTPADIGDRAMMESAWEREIVLM